MQAVEFEEIAAGRGAFDAVTTIPHTVVIDRDGVVRLVARGNHADLDAAVEQIRK